MRKFFIGLFLVTSLAFSSCEEDHVLPAYTQNLAELVTDAYGEARMLVLDDGSRYPVVNRIGDLVPDTLYRVRAMYIPVEKGVELSAAQMTVSPLPVETDSSFVRTDPLELKAIWNSPRYVNMLVGVKTGGGSQVMGFVDEGIDVLPDGRKKACITLFHDQIEDPIYYTQEIYVSCPTYQLTDKLVHGKDSVELTVNTFKGPVCKSFLY